MGSIGVTWRFRIAKIHSIPISKMAAIVAILKILKGHLLPNGSRIKLKLGWRYWGDMEIQNC